MKLSIPETSKMVKSLENKGYIIWKLDEKKERTYLVLTNKAIELTNLTGEAARTELTVTFTCAGAFDVSYQGRLIIEK